MLHEIVKQFFPAQQINKIAEFGNGHINTTYKLSLTGIAEEFILQKINTGVFKNPTALAETHWRLQEVFFIEDQPVKIARLIPTSNGTLLYTDIDGQFWRMTSFIEDSYTIEVIAEDWQALEAGSAFGCFVRICGIFNADSFQEAIRDFHRLSFRIKQLDEAIANNAAGRYNEVQNIVEFYKARQDQLSRIENLVDEGKIPLRVVHNDTKINNLLFRGNKAVAVIDLDTVGPGILCYDYGDALRTSASTGAEDEPDPMKIDFNMNAFAAFTKGYLQQVRSIAGACEAQYFYLAPRLMTFIMGIRFLADYLNGDVYYKTKHARHNLDRSLVQKKLIESMEGMESEMKAVIEQALEDV
jgi:hypothetical protein